MKNREFKTKFWREAAASLPPRVQEKYRLDLEQAERWELAFDAAFEFVARARSALFHTLRAAH